jgi:hypothetical protein
LAGQHAADGLAAQHRNQKRKDDEKSEDRQQTGIAR